MDEVREIFILVTDHLHLIEILVHVIERWFLQPSLFLHRIAHLFGNGNIKGYCLIPGSALAYLNPLITNN
jgi:hypothetical protein